MTVSLCPAPDPRHMQLAPETRAGPAAWLEPVRELPETPVLERREVSPASAAAEPEDVPAVASAQGPGPELEPHEPAGLGPRAPAGMAPGVAEPGPDPEPASPWDILGGVSGPELEPHETLDAGPVAPAGTAQGLAKVELDPEPTSPCAVSTRNVLREDEPPILVFPPRLVGQQLSLRFLVSGAGSRGGGPGAGAFPVSRAALDRPSPDVDSCDLGARPSFPTDFTMCPGRLSSPPSPH